MLRSGFSRLWFGETVSVLGTQATFLALPLAAVMILGASPFQMGLLGAVDNMPYLIFGLGVGVLVDRVSRRRLMVTSDLARAVVLASIPLAAAAGVLTLTQLFVVVFAVGVFNIVFDVSYQAQLPDLVAAEQLVDANGKLETSRSLSLVVGPGLAGTLVQLLTAPFAIVVDAASYVASALSIATIHGPESTPGATGQGLRREVTDGLRVVAGDRRLVGIAGAAATVSMAMNAWLAVFVYHLVRDLSLDAGAVGLLFVVFGMGGVVGAVSASRLARMIGVGRLLAFTPIVAGLGGLAVAGVGGSGSILAVKIGGAAAVFGFGLVAFSVTAAGVRQVLAPEASRGRVMATLRFFEWGVMPIGSVVGGLVGEAAGPAAALAVAALVFMFASVWIVASPLRRMKVLPGVV
jgi:MFS family permease